MVHEWSKGDVFVVVVVVVVLLLFFAVLFSSFVSSGLGI